ncbi:hypothetical protein D3C86_1968490 [compost metagenome]
MCPPPLAVSSVATTNTRPSVAGRLAAVYPELSVFMTLIIVPTGKFSPTFAVDVAKGFTSTV